MSNFTPPSYAPARVSIILHQLGWGGVDRVAAILANGFAERGIEAELLVCAEGGPAEEVLKKIVGEKVSLRFFGKTSGSRVRDLVRSFPKIGRYLQATKPDLVLSAGNNVSLFSMFLTRFYCPGKTRLYVKTTNPVLRPYEESYKRFFRLLWYTLIFRFSDGVLTLTDSESRKLIQTFPYLREKLITVSNPYITDEHHPRLVNETALIANKPKLIIAVGRMQQQKRFDVLLQAIAKVSQKMDCRLAILGDGEDRQALDALSKSLGIVQLVDMPGFVTNVHQWLARSDLFVLSSDYEGLPAVVLEALAHNCPVVSTDCFPGAQELLGGASRCDVTPVRDADTLATAIINSLTQGSSTHDLYQLAETYRIGPAIDSHINAINEIMNRKKHENVSTSV